SSTTPTTPARAWPATFAWPCPCFPGTAGSPSTTTAAGGSRKGRSQSSDSRIGERRRSQPGVQTGVVGIPEMEGRGLVDMERDPGLGQFIVEAHVDGLGVGRGAPLQGHLVGDPGQLRPDPQN